MTDFYHVLKSSYKGYFLTIVLLWYTVNCICYNLFNLISKVRQCHLYYWTFCQVQDMWLSMLLLTPFYCDVTIAQFFVGPFDCEVIMKNCANRCGVGPLAIRQLRIVV